MRLLTAALALVLVTDSLDAQSLAPTTSPRPMARTAEAPVIEVQAGQDAQFQTWIAGFRTRALNAGIRAATLNAAFDGVTYNASVVRNDRNQSEFTKQIWEYLDSAASDDRVRNGQAAFARNRNLLAEIEERYGVDAPVVAAVWGLESAYGTFRGDVPLVEALATLSFDARRSRFFEKQLIAALKIIQSGDVAPRKMTGSWAGAMGHTQFMPTSYLAYAADFNGDGKRDIWSDNPADALASTANYLMKFGWIRGQPWGVEVALPDGFDYAQASRTNKKMPSAWGAMGITDVTGAQIPDHGMASILVPAGASGAAFMIFKNFDVIERYNTADAYVIGVGHLADRIAGGGPIRAGWPREDRPLSFDEKQEMQRLLTAKGYSTGGVDGIIGPLTINSVQRFQASVGLIPDGYPSKRMLERLRG